MKMNLNGRAFLLAFVAALLIDLPQANAGGPLYIAGYASDNPGRPYRWGTNPVTYRTDRGRLGNQDNVQANNLVASAFQTWEDVDTAGIDLENTGTFDYDVTADPVVLNHFLNSVFNCEDPAPAAISIVYDVDGSILSSDAFNLDANSVLGIAGFACMDSSAGIYERSVSILNGRFIDGQPSTPSHRTISLTAFKTAQLHEFGHTLGLDHSQINLNCLTEMACSSDDLAGVPVMFPLMLSESKMSLTPDDIAAISLLYPEPSFDSRFARIQGRVLFSDGRTPAQGYNVIARWTGNPRRVAVSSVSGFLYTADAGNSFLPEGGYSSSFGSRDRTLIGFFDLPISYAGGFWLEVEAINNSGNTAFVYGSSVGPIGSELGFQFRMPGKCLVQRYKQPSLPDDDCDSSTQVIAGFGSVVNVDIILIGTPPRFDAWEDEPEF